MESLGNIESLKKHNLSNISQVLKKIISTFKEDPTIINRKMNFKLNDKIFCLEFVIGKKASFSSEQLNGSHEELILYKIEQFIQSNTFNQKELQFIFNYNDKESYVFYLYIYQYRDFLISSEIKKILMQEELKQKEIKKEEKKDKAIEKTYKLIFWNKSGISLGEIIQKTRFFKNPEERKTSLQILINQGKIIMNEDKSSGKIKKIYKPI